MTITLPPLPYGFSALEPHISARTLRAHHDGHHATYVDKVNELSAGGPFAHASLEELVRKSEGKLLQNAAQAWNHTFYFESLTPHGGHRASGILTAAIAEDFGSLEGFRKAFSDVAEGHFGSGWAWLVFKPDGRLAVVETHDAGCPLRDGRQPLLVCDLWEHAYYLDRKNDRAAYIDGFWALTDWQRVGGRLADAKAEALLAAGVGRNGTTAPKQIPTPSARRPHER